METETQQTANFYGRRDPKFWSQSLKYATLFNICVFVFLGNMFTSGITTGFAELIEEFHVSFAILPDIVAWPVFCQGAANLIWMPLALCVGKRPIILLTIAILFFGSIWSAVAGSYNSLLGARIFACLGSGSVESIGAAMIGDMFFERNFATAMAIYLLALSAGSNIGPLIGGYLIEAQGWRWFFWLNAILAGANFITAVLFLPETSYSRVYIEGETAADLDKDVMDAEEIEKKVVVVETSEGPTNVAVPRQQAIGYGTGYWRDLFRFKLDKVDYHGPVFLAYQFSLPFRFLLIPGTLFAAGAFGLTLGWNVVISVIVPSIFSPPPYNFSSSSIGLFGIAAFIGTIISFPIAGPLTDFISRKLGERRGGHQPEYRIPALIFPFIICPVGLIVFGYTYIPLSSYLSHLPPLHYTAPWIRPAVGFAMVAAGLGLVPSVLLSYIVDSYPVTSGEALVLVNATKNFIAFGLTKGSASWMAKAGVRKMFVSMAGIFWGFMILAVPLFIFGAWIRKRTAWALTRTH